MSLRLMLSICMGFACLIAASSSTGSKAEEKKAPSYSKDVAPLLKDACASCHTGVKRKAGLDVTSYDSLMKFVKAGDPGNSKLHKSLTGKGGKPMPPKNPLADDQIELVRAWIANGAKKD